MKGSQLLCTFINRNDLLSTIKQISLQFKVINQKVVTVVNLYDLSEVFCVYNIENTPDRDHDLPKTILVHRKKDTNTLYTINSLNRLISILNNGQESKDFIVP